jgi:hypothetical protein
MTDDSKTILEPHWNGIIPVSEIRTTFEAGECNNLLNHGWGLLGVRDMHTDPAKADEPRTEYVLGKLTE